MNEIILTLPDGKELVMPKGAKVMEAAEKLGRKLAKRAICARIDGELVGLSQSLDKGGPFELLDFEAEPARAIYRHTAAHIMAQAVTRLYPAVKLAIGPAIEDGFYYDFDVPKPFSPEDLGQIEKEMAKIIQANYPIESAIMDRDHAIAHFQREKETYKAELVEDLPPDAKVTFFRQGEFMDLCAGPHLVSTGRVKAFKLLSLAGAYWRGDERRPMLQRIYGTAFDKKSDLDAYLQRLEEQKRRDHRRLGRELDLFSTHEEGGAGLVYWHPKGAMVRQLVEEFWRNVHNQNGYGLVYSPHIAKVDLWKTSGHWQWYKDDMYSPIKIDDAEYLLKPMNCPFHILIYQTQTRSYRDLPLRYAELGTVYRYERSGALHGLLRVRGFTQDDAHIFCRPEQLEDELVRVLELADFMAKSFDYESYDVILSVRDVEDTEHYIGDDEVWEQAEGALVNALKRKELDYELGIGEAQFYGPKIDIILRDALGRGWQGPTIQVDFNLPERFGLGFVGPDGSVQRPVMIHRTVLGSMERFVGGLIEHYGGAFPPWLAPVQVVVLPIADRHHEYAEKVGDELRQAGLRAEVDVRNEKIGFKIRWHEMQKVPFMLIVGDREAETEAVSLRARGEGDQGSVPLGKAMEDISAAAKMPRFS